MRRPRAEASNAHFRQRRVDRNETVLADIQRHSASGVILLQRRCGQNAICKKIRDRARCDGGVSGSGTSVL